MIEIAAAVCLIATPERCRDVALTFDAEAQSLTPFQCMMYGQAELAKWTTGHPNWKIAKWSCREAGQVANL
jgi:hypothetical protein